MSNGTSAEEYYNKRCDEILVGDKDYQGSNLNILSVEEELIQTLSKEQIKLFSKYESECAKQETYAHLLIYKTAIQDKNSIP